MRENADIEGFIASTKAEGRSSPEGFAWHEYWEWLESVAPRGAGKPPVPLILGASGESDAAKHFRLSEQLYWAAKHGLLPQALDKLKTIPSDKGNSSPTDRWNRTIHPWE